MIKRKNKALSLLLIGFVLFATAGFRGNFQTTEEETATVRITQVDTSEFPKVTVYVTVVDQNGEPMGVDPARIRLSENGQEIPLPQTESIGEVGNLSALLVVDVSGSMWAEGKLDAAKAASQKFIAQMRPGDQVGLISFSESVTLVQPLTTDRDVITQAVKSLEAEGDTAMYDALEMAVQNLEPVQGRKAVIALTDGLDNSSFTTVDDVLDKIGPSGLSISTVGLGNPEHGPGSVTALDEDALIYLAENAGGVYGTADNLESLSSLYESYAVALKSEYVFSYISPLELRDGVNRALTVSLTSPSGEPSAEEVQQVVYNPGGLLPEVSEPAPWPVFINLVGILAIALFLPGLFSLVFKRSNGKPVRTQSRIKLKD